MTIDGLLEYEEIRDFLYSRMRGVRSEMAETRGFESESADAPREQLSDSLTTTLSAVASEVAGLRKDLAHRTTAAARIEQGDDR
jgi:hypothetical protein